MGVSATRSSHVFEITFGSAKANSLGVSLLSELEQSLRAAAATDATVIALRSEGDGAFCAGASFDELKELREQAQATEFFLGFGKVLLAMIEAPQLVVTRVQGKAAGGGVGIIAASDYAVAADGAAARLSEVSLGFGPFVIGEVVRRKVGDAAFQAMTVDATWRDSAWCLHRGLFSQVTSQLDTDFDAKLETLSKLSRSTAAALKEMFWGERERLRQVVESRAAVSATLWLSCGQL